MGSKNKKSKKNQNGEPKVDTGAAAGVNRFGKTAITDSRFSHAQSDPKFAGPRKDKEKVAIDSRFRHAFTDKRFAVSNAPIDKRGKRKKGTAENDLKRHYRMEEEEEEEIEERKRKRTRKPEVAVEESGSDEESESEEEEEESEKPAVKSSELELKNESDSSDEEKDDNDEVDDQIDGETSTDTTDSEEDEDYSDEEDTFVQEENVPEIDKETRRLAVVNLDWSNVKAVDLFVLLSSFLPKGGFIESVAVYPSEFGLQRMEEEAAKGPVGLFDNGKGSKDGDDNEDDDDDDDGEIDNKKLRAYELSRMKYYYAVVTCDSVPTSDYLYKSCDGVEFERSSNKLDLRFIPDSMEFKHPPRDIAKEAPAKYEGVDFHSRALQHSNIQLTWDEDEPQRANMLKRKFNADQLADLELNGFLASDGSESDEDDNTQENGTEEKPKKKDRYRALLESGDGSDEDEEEGAQDMEVTFNTGLENLSKRLLEKKDKQSETVWEAHLRKMKEKKKARRNRSNNSSDDESSDEFDEEPREEIDDFFLEEPSSTKGTKDGARKKSDGKGKKDLETDKEAEASRAELELLLADDNGGDPNLKGYNMKPKKVKGKKGKEIPEEGKIPAADLEDERFSRIFTSHLYALDPTDPQFKRSATYARQLQRKGGREDVGPEARREDESPADDLEKSKDDLPVSKDREKHELSSLVKSIKMKSKQAQVAPSSKVKMSRKK